MCIWRSFFQHQLSVTWLGGHKSRPGKESEGFAQQALRRGTSHAVGKLFEFWCVAITFPVSSLWFHGMDVCSGCSPIPTEALEDCAALKEYIRSHGKEAWAATVSPFSSFAKGNGWSLWRKCRYLLHFCHECINLNKDDTNLHMCGWLAQNHDRLLRF